MNINLNNYESIFLMYVDNELSVAERLLVERFIGEYPYLKAELELLQEVVLPKEQDIVLEKDNLYRSVSSEDFEESMLLHLDNELNEKNTVQLLQQIESDNAVKESWLLLQKTKLDTTALIIFQDKAILYRSEGQRTIIGRFSKWAVAAALIAAGFFAGISVITKQYKTAQGISKNGTGNINKNESGVIDYQQSKIAQEDNNTNNRMQDSLALQKSVNIDNNLAQNTNVLNESKNIHLKKQGPKNETGTTKNTNGIGQQLEVVPISNQSLNVLASNSEKITIKQPEANDTKTIIALASLQKPDVRTEILDTEIKPMKNSFAKVAVWNDNEEINDNHILLMDEATVSQSKAGVFFKKLKRTVARATNLKTGSSLKIAGFEFAVK